MHLRYSMMKAEINCNENRHPQEVMRELGISYQHATPQSMGDQWWFWNCKVYMGMVLPCYLSELGVKPHDAIGWGLDKDMADAIAEGEEV